MADESLTPDEKIIFLVGVLSFLALTLYPHLVARLRRDRPETLPAIYRVLCFQLAGIALLLAVISGRSSLPVLLGFLSATLLMTGFYLLSKRVSAKYDAAWIRSDKEEGTRQMRIFAIEDAEAARKKRKRIDL